jgi:hypothetical protein
MGIVVPTAPAYKMAWDLFKDFYTEMELKLTNIEWWARQYGF